MAADDTERPENAANLPPAAGTSLPVARAFVEGIPHNQALGLRVRALRTAEATFELPYDVQLAGDPDTGVLHGGALTALIDACSGASVFAALTRWQPIATLDLRIDHLRPAEVGRDVVCRAHCYQLTRHVAFTRAVAFHDDEASPVATSMGTFMIGTRRGPARRPR